MQQAIDDDYDDTNEVALAAQPQYEENEDDDNTEDEDFELPDYSTWQPPSKTTETVTTTTTIALTTTDDNENESIQSAIKSTVQVEDVTDDDIEDEEDIPNYENWSIPSNNKKFTPITATSTSNTNASDEVTASSSSLVANKPNNSVNNHLKALGDDFTFLLNKNAIKPTPSDKNNKERTIALNEMTREDTRTTQINMDDHKNNKKKSPVSGIFNFTPKTTSILDLLSDEEEDDEDAESDSDIDSLSYEEWKKKQDQKAALKKSAEDQAAEQAKNMLRLFDQMKGVNQHEASVDMLPDEHEEFLRWMFPLTAMKE